MNEYNRVFINYRSNCADLWAEALDMRQRHPVYKTALGDKTRCNHYANICGVSSYV